MPPGACDRELVLRARQGEVAALGVLLERHRPALLGAALALTRDPHRAEDAVQEVCVTALRRIGDVRDPAAVGAWFHAVLRNVCRQQWRASAARAATVSLDAAGAVASQDAGAMEALERAELRDWVWTALRVLPEPIRVTALLRFFGRWSSYEEVAAILGVPVGTVRSRLHHARGRLAAALLDTALSADTAAATLSAAQARDLGEATAEMNAGVGWRRFAEAFADDLRIGLPGGETLVGRRHLDAVLEDDVRTGTQLRLTRVLASGSITVLEGDLENPPEHAGRCPPATCQVHVRPDGRTTQVRVYFAAVAASADAPHPRPA